MRQAAFTDTDVVDFFRGVVVNHPPALRGVILDDIKNLLKGNRGDCVERNKPYRELFLDVCRDMQIPLAFPIR